MTAASPALATTADAERLVAEIRALRDGVGASLWKMGRALEKLHARRDFWEARYESWNEFAERELNLTGQYVFKLIDVSRTFTEAQVAAIGTAKLIRLLPVPPERRPPLLALARKSTVNELRAAVNRDTLAHAERDKSGALPAPVRETGRFGATGGARRFVRPILHTDAEVKMVALYRGGSTAGRPERAKRIEDRPLGRLLLGATAYTIEVRSTDAGLVAAVSKEAADA